MFVGHGAIAFAIVALTAVRVGVDRRHAVTLATAAMLFATVPDIDMVYAVTGLTTIPGGGVIGVAESFWAASSVVHRSITHSLVIAIPASIVFALTGRSKIETLGASIIAASIIGVVWSLSGVVPTLIATLFVIAGASISVGLLRAGVSRTSVALTAIVGLVTHPFGDVLTGQPPALFYPLPIALFDGRVALATDPTLHLLGAFAFELVAIWMGVYAFATLHDIRLRQHLKPRATVGAAYATAIVAVPPPTLDASYTFVFSVLAVGTVGVIPLRKRLPDPVTAVVTGLAGVTVAATAYGVAYVLFNTPPLITQSLPVF